MLHRQGGRIERLHHLTPRLKRRQKVHRERRKNRGMALTLLNSEMRNQGKIADIVFVHGLGSNSAECWKNEKSGFSLPEWLTTQFQDRAIWLFEYQTHKFLNRGETYHKRYANLLDALEAEYIGERPLIFVCHSLGGIIVKQLLRMAQLDSRYFNIFSATAAVAFIATPHSGSSLAKLPPRLIVSKETRSLMPDSDALDDLKYWYSSTTNSKNLTTNAYCETVKTKIPGWFPGAIVVDNKSSDPTAKSCHVVCVSGADHISIAKPEKDDDLCRSIRRLIEGANRLGPRVILNFASGQGLNKVEGFQRENPSSFFSMILHLSVLPLNDGFYLDSFDVDYFVKGMMAPTVDKSLSLSETGDAFSMTGDNLHSPVLVPRSGVSFTYRAKLFPRQAAFVETNLMVATFVSPCPTITNRPKGLRSRNSFLHWTFVETVRKRSCG